MAAKNRVVQPTKKTIPPPKPSSVKGASVPTGKNLNFVIPVIVLVVAVIIGISKYSIPVFTTLISSYQKDTKSQRTPNTDEVVVSKFANPEGKPREAIKDCVDRYKDDCKKFAENGDCPNYPGWLTINCPASCGFCHLREPSKRCRYDALNISSDPVYDEGDMTAMFESISQRYSEKYQVSILSTGNIIVI